jgi:hypothetical protein
MQFTERVWDRFEYFYISKGHTGRCRYDLSGQRCNDIPETAECRNGNQACDGNHEFAWPWGISCGDVGGGNSV